MDRSPEEELPGENDRLFRLNRTLGLQEPEEYNLAVQAFFAVIILAVMDWRYCWQCVEALAVSLVRLALFGPLVALIP